VIEIDGDLIAVGSSTSADVAVAGAMSEKSFHDFPVVHSRPASTLRRPINLGGGDGGT
jgi:hypothetical protein